MPECPVRTAIGAPVCAHQTLMFYTSKACGVQYITALRLNAGQSCTYLVIACRGNEGVVLTHCNIRHFSMMASQCCQEASIVATPNLDQPIVGALAQWICTQCTHSNKCSYRNYECPLNVCECMKRKAKVHPYTA